MIDNNSKTILTIATILIDLALVTALTTCSLGTYDKLFVIVCLMAHIPFYACLWNYNRPILDALHYFLFVALVASIFLNHPLTLSISLSVLVFIQVMWVLKDRCILNEEGQSIANSFGFGPTFSFLTGGFTLLVATKLGQACVA